MIAVSFILCYSDRRLCLRSLGCAPSNGVTNGCVMMVLRATVRREVQVLEFCVGDR